jgi:DNA-binding NarL/FixJ family response regulator
MPERPVRLAIVSRQEVVARGLTAMLADYPDRVIVTVLPSVFAPATGVDVVLYDTLGLHQSEGADLRHLIEGTDAQVLIYARDMRPDLRARALAMGAPAWVSMSIRSAELVVAVEDVAAGRPVSSEAPAPVSGLSPREEEILALIAQGLSNQEITEKLFMTLNTLKSHIRAAYRKVGVASRSQAVAWALQHGFPPTEPVGPAPTGGTTSGVEE